MFSQIVRNSVRNAKRLLYIWLAVLIVNQIFVFGACFAPYCLAAAIPHTLAISILINFFGFVREPGQKSSESLLTPEARRLLVTKLRTFAIFIGVVLVFCTSLFVLKKYSESRKTSAEVTYDGKSPPKISAANQPVLNESKLLTNLVADEHGRETQDTQEFEHPGYDEAQRIHIAKEETPAKKRRISEAPNSASATAPSRPAKTSSADGNRPYLCTNSSAIVSEGTGRPSREGEYSTFLNRRVYADEFVLFRYKSSNKVYWYKSSNCQEP